MMYKSHFRPLVGFAAGLFLTASQMIVCPAQAQAPAPATRPADIPTITKAMSDCDAVAALEPGSLYFLITPLVTVQQLGFATAVAIAIDATIVRLIMVPAAMRLMGRWNWWLPRAMTPYRGRHRCGHGRAPTLTREAAVAQWVP